MNLKCPTRGCALSGPQFAVHDWGASRKSAGSFSIRNSRFAKLASEEGYALRLLLQLSGLITLDELVPEEEFQSRRSA